MRAAPVEVKLRLAGPKSSPGSAQEATAARFISDLAAGPQRRNAGWGTQRVRLPAGRGPFPGLSRLPSPLNHYLPLGRVPILFLPPPAQRSPLSAGPALPCPGARRRSPGLGGSYTIRAFVCAGCPQSLLRILIPSSPQHSEEVLPSAPLNRGGN